MDLNQYARAIASIESAGSGDYQAVGPRTGKGNRAYGRYQVMDFNIGPWTEKYLGQRLTPEQFLASPEAQDAVFRGEFGSYIERYGNPQDAASAWFTGQPLSTGAGRSDILGTTGAGYVEKFNAALGQPQGGNMQPQGLLSTSGQAEPERLPFFQRPQTADFFDRLAIGLGGLTLNPNQALIQASQERLSERREERKAAAQRNLTAAWLESQGLTQIAQGVTTGAIPATTALTIYQAQAKAAKDPNVQSSAMLPDQSGTVLTMRDGGIQVVTVGGETLSGQDAIDFVKKAQEKNVEYQQSIYRARRLGTGLGETAAADISAAPATISTADTTLAYIDALRNHPGIEMGTGFSSTFNAIPGTPGYDFQNRVKQISSGAFMTAIQDLRGMGALSNAEGDTATKAVARMDTATSKEEFLAALADYERIVQAGRARAQKTIETQGGQAPAAGAPSGGGTTRLRYNATTGQMEPVND